MACVGTDYHSVYEEMKNLFDVFEEKLVNMDEYFKDFKFEMSYEDLEKVLNKEPLETTYLIDITKSAFSTMINNWDDLEKRYKMDKEKVRNEVKNVFYLLIENF